MKIVFLDIFTTQNELYDSHNCPIQFTYEEFDESDIYDKDKFIVNVENRKTFNIIPDEDIMTSGHITSSISNDDIKDEEFEGKSLHESLSEIYNLLKNAKDSGYFIAGFNHVNYDLNILNQHFSRILNVNEPLVFDKSRIIDVMKFSEYLIPVKKIGNYSMDSVFVYLFKDLNKLNSLRHVKSTITDINITKIILLKILSTLKKDKKFTCGEIVKIINMLEEKNEYINFGKYKGLKIEEVMKTDSQYLTWMMNNKSFKEQNPVLIGKIKKMIDNSVV